jgi:hypothetical protein
VPVLRMVAAGTEARRHLSTRFYFTPCERKIATSPATQVAERADLILTFQKRREELPRASMLHHGLCALFIKSGRDVRSAPGRRWVADYGTWICTGLPGLSGCPGAITK